MYLIQRTIDRLEGEVVDENELSGEIIWTDEQTFLGASNEVLLIDVRRWIPQEANKHTFNLARISSTQCPPRSLAEEKDL